MSGLRIYAAQINSGVGNLHANTQAIIHLAQTIVQEQSADLLLVPELALTGSMPEDLLFKPDLPQRIAQALDQLQQEIQGLSLIVGYPQVRDGQIFNTAAVLHQDQWIAEYSKQHLNNAGVFNEARYFTAGQTAGLVEINGCTLGLLIGSDLHQPELAVQAAALGADAFLVLSADPWHTEQHLTRLHQAQACSQALAKPLVFCNTYGGQGELVFDGASFALNAAGQVIAQAAALQEDACLVQLNKNTQGWDLQALPQTHVTPWPDATAYLYNALVLGLRNYVNSNGFKGVVLGMSGGLDSALSAAIAVDALGAERVMGVMMPYHYTAAISIADAEEEARLLGIEYQVIPIAPMVESFTASLAPSFAAARKNSNNLCSNQKDTTEENLQARCRGVTLMALSNKYGLMLLTTSNKSELAVGYCTLYGDMAGGFNAIKDIYKTTAFELCTWRNQQGYVIPQRVIDRPPSAELAPDQTDTDSLPPYPVLDKLLHGYLEENLSAVDLINQGFQPEDVQRILRLVDLNEYKRRFAAPGTKVSAQAFGIDRHYPLVSTWPHF